MMAIATAMISMTSFAQQVDNSQNRGRRQGPRPDMSKMTEMRANQIANQLSLDDATTAKFTEIYKSYVNDLQAVNTKYHPKKEVSKKEDKNNNDAKQGPKTRPERKALTDKEVEDRMVNGFKEKKEKIEVQENYYKKFRTILNPKQIQKVYAMGGNNGRRGINKGMKPRGGQQKMRGQFRGGKNGGPRMMPQGSRRFAWNAPQSNSKQM